MPGKWQNPEEEKTASTAGHREPTLVFTGPQSEIDPHFLH